MPHSPRFEFGPFLLDLNDRLLTRAGEVISLRPKATEILVRLVTNAGQLIKRDELLKEVWPDTFVEESNLSQTIFTLRKALGDDRSEPRYIETVPRRGYRFVAAVKDEKAENHHDQALPAASTSSVTQPRVVAVLPFLNQTGNPEFDCLADGITDNLINNVSRLSKVHVLPHSTVSVFKTMPLIPQQAAKELGATLVLFGKLSARPIGIVIGVELVDASTGWQLWGESFNSESKHFPEIQEKITSVLLKFLRSTLTGEANQVTTRYTENSEAYESYLEARRHWVKHTRTGIEKAIEHLRHAIASDPNYSLAYAGIVDCFLRLATNYLPPDGICTSEIPTYSAMNSDHLLELNSQMALRLEWDCKGAEREIRRANELKMGYPRGHQWHAAYRTSQRLYEESWVSSKPSESLTVDGERSLMPHKQIALLELTPTEQVQIYCTIGREQIEIGNYEAACIVLRPWWSFGVWPKLDGLDQRTCADLLLTVGVLAGCVASTKQLPKGQRHSEELLNGCVALCEQLGSRRLAAEGKIELGFCYYRQGLYDLGAETLSRSLEDLTDDCWELRSLALIRLATLERHSGRPRDALKRLSEARKIAERCGPWATGRYHLELASSYKDLAQIDNVREHFGEAKRFYSKALYEFKCTGHHRLSAITENNLGLVMMLTGNFRRAESHLARARKIFDFFADKIRRAQVDDSLAQLYFAQERFDDADVSIRRAVQTMENGDEDALLAEALTTNGLIYCKLKRCSQAKTLLENAYRLAQRCGDTEGAGRALAVLVEELFDSLESDELYDIAHRIREIISHYRDLSIHKRLQRCLTLLETANPTLFKTLNLNNQLGK
jgi:DNA-binding winged helix-turn-helix (wHTH) protein/Tfp pilus assembly protein PilF